MKPTKKELEEAKKRKKKALKDEKIIHKHKS